jgi:hypothetical protein
MEGQERLLRLCELVAESIEVVLFLFAFLRAVFDLIPDFLPFFSPSKRPTAAFADFCW